MWFSSGRKGSSIALIDIGSASVGVGLACVEEGTPPTMCYSERVALQHHPSVSLTDAMLHALEEAGGGLIREGAPALRRRWGSGAVDRVLVSVGSPWQNISIRTKSIQPGKPFTFNQALVSEVLASDGAPTEDRTFDQEVIATFLNGYLTKDPYGKRANRAELAILSSSFEKSVITLIEKALRKLFHTHRISYTAFASPCFTVLRDLYPHENEFLVLSVTGEGTDVASIKRGHLVDVGTLPHGTNALVKAVREAGNIAHGSEGLERAPMQQPGYINQKRNVRFAEAAERAEKAWVDALAALLREFAVRHALPRTVFLIADEEVRGFLKQALDTPSLHALWLSDEPVSVLPLAPKQITSHIKFQGPEGGDVALALLALYAIKNPGA